MRDRYSGVILSTLAPMYEAIENHYRDIHMQVSEHVRLVYERRFGPGGY